MTEEVIFQKHKTHSQVHYKQVTTSKFFKRMPKEWPLCYLFERREHEQNFWKRTTLEIDVNAENESE